MNANAVPPPATHEERYLDDFAVGQIYGSGRLRIEPERIKSFAPKRSAALHLDEQRDVVRRAAASGLYAALTRLLVESEFKPAGGIVGAGFDCAGPPVRPGDELHVQSEILENRAAPAEPGNVQGQDHDAQPER
jgi:hypothetical protein